MFNVKNVRRLWAIMLSACVAVCSFAFWVGFLPEVSTEYADASTAIDDYYEGLNDSLTGTAFRSELASLITSTHKYYTSYDGLRDVFTESDADPDNPGKILWFYTGTSVSFSGSFNTGTNREHVWPKDGGDAFPASTGPGSDAHHLRPANQNLNSTRGSNSFGEVPQTSSNIVGENGSTNYKNLCYQAGGVFYPGVGYRGATARILMYMQTRWGDEHNLTFVLGKGSCKTIGDIETLMKWHLEEPPTDLERTRNEVVFGIQGNRNPFIDHPEYAEMIYCHDGKTYNDELQAVVEEHDGGYLGGNAGGTQVEITSLSISPTSADLVVGEKQSFTVTAYPSGARKTVEWSSSNPSVASVSGGSVTALSAGTTTITATSTENANIKATATVTVKAAKSLAVSGDLVKTIYGEGDVFEPTGLTVTVTYTDNTTKVVPNENCSWLDGKTNANTLSMGTTSVICQYGDVSTTITGIVVRQATKKTMIITRDNFDGSGGYAWVPWTSGDISGKGYMYPGKKESIQMNSTKPCKYIFNETAMSGGIVSISIKTTGNKSWSILTSTTPFTALAEGDPEGTNRGTLASSPEGGTLNVATTDQYFAIVYDDVNAVYVTEIVITYGSTHTHNVGDWIVDEYPTCYEEGSQHNECSDCGEVVDIVAIPKVDHTLELIPNSAVAPTCEEDGVEGVYKCTVTGCNHTEDGEAIPSLGHNFGDWQITSNPTCYEEGEETKQCSVCNETRTQPIAKLDHNLEVKPDSKVEPKCDEDGLECVYECTNEGCNYTENGEIIPKTGHSYGDWQVTDNPTCNKEGEESRECSTCGDKETRPIPTTDHNLEVKPDSKVEPKCDEDGLECVYECTNDGCNYTENGEIIPRTGHSYGDWQVTDNPTCNKEGEESRECSTCGDKETRPIPTTDHNLEVKPDSKVEPKCDEDGLECVYECTNEGCEYTENGEIIPKTGHSYGDWTEIDDTQEQRVCTTCGDTETREKADMSQVDAFKDLVEAVKNAEGMNTKWNVIKSALNAYNELDDSEKELVVDAYETLQEEINAYNNLAIATNAESNKATQQAIALLIGSISILSVAAYFLLKR